MTDFFQEAAGGFMKIFYAVFHILWGDFITIPLPEGVLWESLFWY